MDHVQQMDHGPSDPNVIGFHDAIFSWSSDIDGSLTPSKRNFRLQMDGEVIFKRGGINLIIGPTGSGKTSLLMALLGGFFDYDSTFQSRVMDRSSNQVKCTFCHPVPHHGSIFREVVV